jgi:hypothetical protein
MCSEWIARAWNLHAPGELTCTPPAQIPGELSLKLIVNQLPLELRSASPDSSHRWLAIMTKFVIHIRQAALGGQQRLTQHFERMQISGKSQGTARGAGCTEALAARTVSTGVALAAAGQVLDDALSLDVRSCR